MRKHPDKLTMRGQVRNTPHGVALHFHVGAQHLPDERLETAKLYDEQLVVGCHAKSATAKKICLEHTHYLQQDFPAPHWQPAALRCHGC